MSKCYDLLVALALCLSINEKYSSHRRPICELFTCAIICYKFLIVCGWVFSAKCTNKLQNKCSDIKTPLALLKLY